MPVAVKAKSIGVDGLVLEEINYLYGHQVWLESLVRLNRDMASVLESAGKSKEPVGLDWVIDVHNVTTYADEIFGLTLAKNTPVAQRESYSGLYLAELEVIQVMAFGRDRLLSAALVLGPAGRTVGVLDTGESATFNTFLREADFFLRDSERLLDQQTKLVGAALARVRIR